MKGHFAQHTYRRATRMVAKQQYTSAESCTFLDCNILAETTDMYLTGPMVLATEHYDIHMGPLPCAMSSR